MPALGTLEYLIVTLGGGGEIDINGGGGAWGTLAYNANNTSAYLGVGGGGEYLEIRWGGGVGGGGAWKRWARIHCNFWC